jgi:nucleoid DNA-binding protein
MLIISTCFFRESTLYDLILFDKISAFPLDIKAFIRELLFGHDCVIVPGFGGFIGNFSPARVDENSGTFYPPVKQISFNRNLNHNDGLLISKISQSTGVNYGDARHLVEEFVKELTAKLVRGEKVVFDHIGTFVNNHENNVQFEPEANINYHVGSFGLESFQWFPARNYDVRKRVIRHISKEPIKNTSTRKNLWRAAVVIPILALLIAIPLKTDLFKAKIEATSLNPLVTAEFENNKKAVDEAVVVIPDTSIPVKPEAAPIPAEEHHYSIITGSFKSEQNAISHVNSLKADGFNPEINQAPNGFFRVTAMTCKDMQTAVSTRDSISKKFSGTWICKK